MEKEENESISLKKLKLKHELLRFFFGTFLIAVLTLGFNAVLKHWEYRNQNEKMRYEAYDKYLDRFDNTKDKIDKIVLARTLGFIAPDEELRNGYKELYAFLEHIYGKENELEKSKLVKETEQKAVKEKLTQRKPEVIKEFVAVAEDLENETLSEEVKSQAKERFNQLITTNPELNQIVNLEKQIQETEGLIENVRQEAQIPIQQTYKARAPQKTVITKTAWVKEGHAVVLNKSKINCKSINLESRTAKFEIQVIANKEVNPPIKLTLKEGQEKEIHNGKYIFHFIRIGKAGKNPFNQAAFFELKIVDPNNNQ